MTSQHFYFPTTLDMSQAEVWLVEWLPQQACLQEDMVQIGLAVTTPVLGLCSRQIRQHSGIQD